MKVRVPSQVLRLVMVALGIFISLSSFCQAQNEFDAIHHQLKSLSEEEAKAQMDVWAKDFAKLAHQASSLPIDEDGIYRSSQAKKEKRMQMMDLWEKAIAQPYKLERIDEIEDNANDISGRMVWHLVHEGGPILSGGAAMGSGVLIAVIGHIVATNLSFFSSPADLLLFGPALVMLPISAYAATKTFRWFFEKDIGDPSKSNRQAAADDATRFILAGLIYEGLNAVRGSAAVRQSRRVEDHWYKALAKELRPLGFKLPWRKKDRPASVLKFMKDLFETNPCARVLTDRVRVSNPPEAQQAQPETEEEEPTVKHKARQAR